MARAGALDERARRAGKQFAAGVRTLDDIRIQRAAGISVQAVQRLGWQQYQWLNCELGLTLHPIPSNDAQH